VVDQNGTIGIQANGISAAVLVSGSTITQNNVGLSATNGGALFTYGNNEIHGNFTTTGAFTSTLPLQ
jgi:hypothetical protein